MLLARIDIRFAPVPYDLVSFFFRKECLYPSLNVGQTKSFANIVSCCATTL